MTKVKRQPTNVLGSLGGRRRKGTIALSAFFRYEAASQKRPTVPLEFHVFVDGEWTPGLVGASPSVEPTFTGQRRKKASGWIVFEVPRQCEVVLVRDALDGKSAIEIVLREE